jgi:hypothetical protein
MQGAPGDARSLVGCIPRRSLTPTEDFRWIGALRPCNLHVANRETPGRIRSPRSNAREEPRLASLADGPRRPERTMLQMANWMNGCTKTRHPGIFRTDTGYRIRVRAMNPRTGTQEERNREFPNITLDQALIQKAGLLRDIPGERRHHAAASRWGLREILDRVESSDGRQGDGRAVRRRSREPRAAGAR